MKHIVVLTGAGMSAESGVSTFRDAGGLWEKYPVNQVATPEAWQADPALVTEFYNARRVQLKNVSPNEGHKLLASLEGSFKVSVVTQNVDNLHERAGSSHVLHLHGELTKVCSSYNPNDPRYIQELSPEDYEVKIGDTAEDGSQIRPFIVWFGESVPKLDDAIILAQQADIFLIIGTSLNVYPAASLIHFVPKNTPIYLIDPKTVQTPSEYKVQQLQMGASEGMETLIRDFLAPESQN